MKPTAHIVFLRKGPIVISKVHYLDWKDVQDDFDDYMTSLGPWEVDEILSHFQSEYGDESTWVFSSSQIQSFMKSEEHLLKEDNLSLLDLQSKSASTLQFNEYINSQDLDNLASLMTDDHTFIDSANDVHEGKEMMVPGWNDFFTQYPDYRNIFQKLILRDGIVIMLGYSVCSYEPLDGPAIWSAKLRDCRITEWRVYLDTLENRASLGIG